MYSPVDCDEHSPADFNPKGKHIFVGLGSDGLEFDFKGVTDVELEAYDFSGLIIRQMNLPPGKFVPTHKGPYLPSFLPGNLKKLLLTSWNCFKDFNES